MPEYRFAGTVFACLASILMVPLAHATGAGQQDCALACAQRSADVGVQLAQGPKGPFVKGPMAKGKGGPSAKGAPPSSSTAGSGGLHPSPYRWTDVHMHLVPSRGDFSGAVREALRIMDQAGIAKAVVMPTPQSPSAYQASQFTSLLKRYPQRFDWLAGGGELNPMIHATDPAKVSDAVKARFAAKAREILASGAKGFGEMAVLHVSLTSGHPFEQSPADHPLFLLLADIAGEHGAVIDMHIDLVPEDTPTPGALRKYGNPKTLRANVPAFERLLAHNRDARFVLEHVGADPVGFAKLDLLKRLAEAHPNLYFAIRAAPGTEASMHNQMVGPRGMLPEWGAFLGEHSDRFLFGTDSFMAVPGTGGGPGAVFSQRNINKLILHNRILTGLRPPVARKIAIDNPRVLFGSDPG